jgi:hypothetical protein
MDSDTELDSLVETTSQDESVRDLPHAVVRQAQNNLEDGRRFA